MSETLPVPATGTALTDHERESIARHMENSFAANTRSNYKSRWSVFAKWCEDHDCQALPASSETLIRYLNDRVEGGRSAATVRAAQVAIVKRHVEAGLPSPANEAVRRLMKGIGNGLDDPRQAGPIMWEQAIAAAALSASDNTLAGLRDAALLVTMSDGLLRISEAAGLTVDDLEAEAPYTVRVRRSKTDQAGEGAVLPLRRSTVRRLRTWLAAASITEGPIFRRLRRGGNVVGGGLTPGSLREIIRARAQAAGIEGRISGHSLRIGSAKSAAERGLSLVGLQIAGRWRSPKMPGYYVRGQEAARSPLRKLWGE